MLPRSGMIAAAFFSGKRFVKKNVHGCRGRECLVRNGLFPDGAGLPKRRTVACHRSGGARMPLSRCAGMLLLAAAPLAPLSQVFKCVDGGAVSYQSAPCAGVTAKIWTIEPAVAAPAPLRQRVAPSPRVRPAATESRTRWQGRTATRNTGADACSRAKAGREAAYRKAGLKRDFRLSSLWDNRVHDACR